MGHPKAGVAGAKEEGLESKDLYQISTSWNEDTLEMRLSGQGTPNNADLIAKKVFEIVEVRRPKKVLIDITNMRGRLGIIDTYRRVQDYPPIHVIAKTAVVDLPENHDQYAFHETAMVNLGFQIRFFSDIQKARAWLEE